MPVVCPGWGEGGGAEGGIVKFRFDRRIACKSKKGDCKDPEITCKSKRRLPRSCKLYVNEKNGDCKDSVNNMPIKKGDCRDPVNNL